MKKIYIISISRRDCVRACVCVYVFVFENFALSDTLNAKWNTSVRLAKLKCHSETHDHDVVRGGISMLYTEISEFPV